MTEPARKTVRMEEYLHLEEQSLTKHEYIGGFIYPLRADVGVSEPHSLVSGNIFGNLFPEAKRQKCRLHAGEMRLRVGNALFYPDVMLLCGERDEGRYYVTNPCLLAEVLSPSTASHDRVGKYAMYTGISTLQTYLMVEQDERRVYEYQRTADGWQLRELVDEGEIHIPCLGITITLDDVYDGVF